MIKITKQFKLLIILIVLSTNSSFAINWLHYKVDSFENIDLTGINLIQQLENTDHFWVSSKYGQYIFTKDSIIKIENNLFKRHENQVKSIIEDRKGNIIAFFPISGFVVMNEKNSISYDNLNIKNLPGFRSICLKNDTIFAIGINYKLYAFYYDESKEKYTLINEEGKSLTEDQVLVKDMGPIIAFDNKLIMVGKQAIYDVNIDGSLTSKIKFKNVFESKISAIQSAKTSNNQLMFSSSNTDTTTSLFVVNSNFENYYEMIVENDDLPYPLLISDIENYNNKNFLAANTKLLMESNKNYTEINHPDEIENLISEWNILEICIDKSDSLWVGTMRNGIFKCNINEIINSMSVEDDKFLGIKKLSIHKIFPLPSKNNILNIEYNLLLENSQVDVNFFDINGQIIDKSKYKILDLSTNGTNFYTMKIEINNMEKGIYFIKLSSSNIHTYSKLILD